MEFLHAWADYLIDFQYIAGSTEKECAVCHLKFIEIDSHPYMSPQAEHGNESIHTARMPERLKSFVIGYINKTEVIPHPLTFRRSQALFQMLYRKIVQVFCFHSHVK